jgi:hypothetical protein
VNRDMYNYSRYPLHVISGEGIFQLPLRFWLSVRSYRVYKDRFRGYFMEHDSLLIDFC